MRYIPTADPLCKLIRNFMKTVSWYIHVYCCRRKCRVLQFWCDTTKLWLDSLSVLGFWDSTWKHGNLLCQCLASRLDFESEIKEDFKCPCQISKVNKFHAWKWANKTLVFIEIAMTDVHKYSWPPGIKSNSQPEVDRHPRCTLEIYGSNRKRDPHRFFKCAKFL